MIIFSSSFIPLLPNSRKQRKKVKSLSHVQLFVSPWTVIAYQAPLSMGFSSKSSGVGCHFLLQGNLPHPGIELT